MSRCMDSFLTTHTRLVVIVDGLDSCEQEKLLQVTVIDLGFQTAFDLPNSICYVFVTSKT